MQLSTTQRNELKSLPKLLCSEDKESVKLGFSMLRKSQIYKDLRTATLFYYPFGFENGSKHLVKTIIKNAYAVRLKLTNSGYKLLTKNELRNNDLMRSMFSSLTGKNPEKHFRREFITTIF